MAEPLKKTFETLLASRSPQAIDTLIHALDVPLPAIQSHAVRTLIKRQSTRGCVEVVRRWQTLESESQKLFQQESKRMETALQQSLLHGDAELQSNGLRIVEAIQGFDYVPVLVEMLSNVSGDIARQTTQMLTDLVNLLYDQLHQSKDQKSKATPMGNAGLLKQNILTCLDKACSDFKELTRPREIVEAILILGGIDNFAVDKVLTQAHSECRKLAKSLLLSSRHPGVMQLAVESISKNYPHPTAVEAIQTRDDIEFITHLLRWFPQHLSPIQFKNLEQIEHVAWVESDEFDLDLIPDSLQAALARFISVIGIPPQRKLAIQEWLVRYGGIEGRSAAADVLANLSAESVEGIVFEGLDSDDEHVQAWATTQLRQQHVPETFSLLIEKLDSPLPAVQAAAREELASFNVSMMFDLYEELEPSVCRSAGQLIQKIDPNCFDDLIREINNPIRRKKIRGARVAHALGLHQQVLPALLTLLDDSDSVVRRTGLEIIADVPTPETVEAIQNHLEDPSERVRETAEKSLQQISRNLSRRR